METAAVQTDLQSKVEPLLLEVADVVNTTLDLDTTLRRVAELVRKVFDYEIFAILLLNEKTQELRIRFNVGYKRELADKIRIKMGEGVTGLAAQHREAILGTIVNAEGRQWFIKLKGDAELAARETEHFEQFVQSIRFRKEQ